MTKNDGGNRLEKIKQSIFSQGRKDRPREPEFSAMRDIGCGPHSGQNQRISSISQEAQGELTEMQLINTFLSNVYSFLSEKRDEAGQTLVEYALIIALISLLVVGLAVILSGTLTETFESIGDALTGAGS
jgi:Flp pilus assembly pilin Flp